MERNIYERYGQAMKEIEWLRAALRDDILYLNQHRNHLQDLLDQRDKFIVDKGLWAEFIYSLGLGDGA